MPMSMAEGVRSYGRDAMRRAEAMPENRFRQEYYDDIARTGRLGAALSDRFAGGISEFSPQMAFEKRVRAAQEQTRDRLGRDLERLRGSQVRSGRLNTGFAVEDEDRLWIDSMRDLQSLIGSAALQTSGQELNRLSLMGSYGDRASQRAMDARAGELYSLRDQRLEDTRSKRDFAGNLIGSLLTAGGAIAGGLIGGPGGAMAGASGGRALGGAIGGRTPDPRRRTDAWVGGA